MIKYDNYSQLMHTGALSQENRFTKETIGASAVTPKGEQMTFYGGSTQNRIRLLIKVTNAVREAVGQDFIVGVRISQGKINDYHHKWADKEKDAETIFGQLGQAGLDYIHVTEFVNCL
jgi:arabinogalactan endo-1,4-beta-galactosidase